MPYSDELICSKLDRLIELLEALQRLLVPEIAPAGKRSAAPSKGKDNSLLATEQVTASETKLQRRFIQVSKWNEYHEWPSQGGLRHLIFHAETNGFKSVIRRIGRSVLIDEAEFFRWVDKHK